MFGLHVPLCFVRYLILDCCGGGFGWFACWFCGLTCGFWFSSVVVCFVFGCFILLLACLLRLCSGVCTCVVFWFRVVCLVVMLGVLFVSLAFCGFVCVAFGLFVNCVGAFVFVCSFVV